MTASQDNKNSDEIRLRAIENIKTLENLLSFFENYKEE
nr:MAG TPA: Rotatin, an armadillo repeat protein, centriole functioning [Caudoviricetes sp.]